MRSLSAFSIALGLIGSTLLFGCVSVPKKCGATRKACPCSIRRRTCSCSVRACGFCAARAGSRRRAAAQIRSANLADRRQVARRSECAATGAVRGSLRGCKQVRDATLGAQQGYGLRVLDRFFDGFRSGVASNLFLSLRADRHFPGHAQVRGRRRSHQLQPGRATAAVGPARSRRGAQEPDDVPGAGTSRGMCCEQFQSQARTSKTITPSTRA